MVEIALSVAVAESCDSCRFASLALLKVLESEMRVLGKGLHTWPEVLALTRVTSTRQSLVVMA